MGNNEIITTTENTSQTALPNRRISANAQISLEDLREIEEYFPQYILYRREGKQIDGYCTGCKRYAEIKPDKTFKLEHGAVGKCPNCGCTVTFFPGGKVPASRKERLNFVVMYEKNGELHMHAIKVTQKFTKGTFDEWNGISDYDTDYFVSCRAEYWCSAGTAEEWKDGRGWLRECHEPDFGGAFGYRDNSYIVIGMERIKDTCLRYCGYEKFVKICEEISDNCPLITFLCESAQHPALEKLMKSGFEYIVKDKILRGGVRLNYCGDTPQKILRLNTDEIKALKGCNADEYNCYLYFRKNIHISGDFKRKFERFEQFAMIISDIVKVAKETGLSHEKVMNYIDRQTKGDKRKNYLFMRDWQDYLRQCETLGYNLADEGIVKSSDFQKMHERLSKIIETRQDEIMREKFAALYEERRELEFESGRLMIIQPESVGDIIAEGKALCHCVGGYTDRHTRGELSIMFLRLKSHPKRPYYTIEVSKEGKIVQCRGYKNNARCEKPKSVRAFELEYQKHLDKVMDERKKRERRKKAFPKTQEKIGA